MRSQRQKKNTAKEIVNGHMIVKIGRGVWRLEGPEGQRTTGSKSKVTSDAYTLEPGSKTTKDLGN